MQHFANFSNAARKAFTRTKQATLLGGLGTIKEGAPVPKEQRRTVTKEVPTPPPKYKGLLSFLNPKKPATPKTYTTTEKFTPENPLNDRVGYVDAIQIARRGGTSPIKSNSYIDRQGYINNPQDNTVLAGTIDRLRKTTSADSKNEYGALLYKDNPKDTLKTTPITGGGTHSVKLYSGNIEQDKKSLINIHTHPPYAKKIAGVTPSPRDFQMDANQRYDAPNTTSLILANSPTTGQNHITQYKTSKHPSTRIAKQLEEKMYSDANHPNGGEWDDRKDFLNTFRNYRQNVKNLGGDYKVISNKTNQ
jgi:hypothetical protein